MLPKLPSSAVREDEIDKFDYLAEIYF